MICGKKCRVSGRVQGVYFRGSAQKQALALGVTGSAKNLSNGCVEVCMFGEYDALEALQNWLFIGPQYAQVSKVQCDVVTVDHDRIPKGFIVE